MSDAIVMPDTTELFESEYKEAWRLDFYWQQLKRAVRGHGALEELQGMGLSERRTRKVPALATIEMQLPGGHKYQRPTPDEYIRKYHPETLNEDGTWVRDHRMTGPVVLAKVHARHAHCAHTRTRSYLTRARLTIAMRNPHVQTHSHMAARTHRSRPTKAG